MGRIEEASRPDAEYVTSKVGQERSKQWNMHMERVRSELREFERQAEAIRVRRALLIGAEADLNERFRAKLAKVRREVAELDEAEKQLTKARAAAARHESMKG
jgi:hypothetical protein